MTISGTPENVVPVFERRLNIFGETDPSQAGSATRRFGGNSYEVVHDVSVVHLLEVRALVRPAIGADPSGVEPIPLRFTFELENFPLYTSISVPKVMDQRVQIWAPETGDVHAETNRRIEYIMLTIVERWTMDLGGNIFGHERKVLEKKWPEKIEGEFSVPRRIKVTIPPLPRSGEQHGSIRTFSVMTLGLFQPISKKLAGGMNKERQQLVSSSSRRGASPDGSPRLQLLQKAPVSSPREEVDDCSFLTHEIGDHNPKDYSAASSSSRMGRSPSDPGSQYAQISLGMNGSQQVMRNVLSQWSKASNDRYELKSSIFIASHSVEQARALLQLRPDILL
ncbi:hypothetical protein BJ742DRAFT_765964 [Cladochytrium replicatum]|nr:hypothetical protein BJ742DRAFT_765964 [Cladochytrium replicatum]